jgi:hypothetical protein
MEMNIHVKITDPDVMGEIFALFGRSKTPVDLVVDVDPPAPAPRNATPPPPPPTDDPPEYGQPVRPTEVTMVPDKPAPEKKRGRPAKAEQIAIPAGEVTASQMVEALKAIRGKWGIDAARAILRDVGNAEKPEQIARDKWTAVVDACNAYQGAAAINMDEFL